MAQTSREENENFENEVRRIARQLWPAAQFGGARIVGGRERDGIFETEESIHLVEATTSSRKAKAEEDCKKLSELFRSYRSKVHDRAIRRWFITRAEPTAEQRAVATRFEVIAMSFSQFQSKLIDSKSYLSARDQYHFGSVRDPATGTPSPAIDFIPLDLSPVSAIIPTDLTGLLEKLHLGGRLVLLGDFGAGKSMTLRYLYRQLRLAHLKGETPRFPVFINLRDHYGQTDPTEVLERHARLIGFESPPHLVRAWRSGYVHLLLDGFDETTGLSIQGLWTRLRENRYRAMEVLRRFAGDHPEGAGLVMAGRAHFFDNLKERQKALGLTSRWAEFSLNEFTDEQISQYLKKAGLSGSVPSWLPSRPLLVAYLASKGLLAELISDSDADPAAGWDILLQSIASREARIEAGIDGETIRRILERLATRARSDASGRGPLNHEALVETFREICGYNPDERGMVLLQRLPGLGADSYEDGSRAFIDEEFADACRSGDIFHFAQSPYQFKPGAFGSLEISSGLLAIDVAVRRAQAQRLTSGQLNAAVQRAQDVSSAVFLSDIARLTLASGHNLEQSVVIRGVIVPELELLASMGDARRLEFRDCFFRKVDIDPDVVDESLPRFKTCFIDEIDGRVSHEDLPGESFDPECIIESFTAGASTTSEVLLLDLPLGTKVTLTILKKLFDRPGKGRREGALYRGLDQRAQELVPKALRVIQREELVTAIKRGSETIWLPDRASLRRVGQMISAPVVSDDPLLQKVADL